MPLKIHNLHLCVPVKIYILHLLIFVDISSTQEFYVEKGDFSHEIQLTQNISIDGILFGMANSSMWAEGHT